MRSTSSVLARGAALSTLATLSMLALVACGGRAASPPAEQDSARSGTTGVPASSTIATPGGQCNPTLRLRGSAYMGPAPLGASSDLPTDYSKAIGSGILSLGDPGRCGPAEHPDVFRITGVPVDLAVALSMIMPGIWVAEGQCVAVPDIESCLTGVISFRGHWYAEVGGLNVEFPIGVPSVAIQRQREIDIAPIEGVDESVAISLSADPTVLYLAVDRHINLAPCRTYTSDQTELQSVLDCLRDLH